MAERHAADEESLNAAVGARKGQHDPMPAPGDLCRARPMFGEERPSACHRGAVARHVEMGDVRTRLVLGGETSGHVEAGDRRQDGAIEAVTEVASTIDDIEKSDIS